MLPIMDMSQIAVPPFERTHGKRWMTDLERSVVIALLAHVQAETVVEIGVNEGHLAFDVLKHLPVKRYIGIDLAPHSTHMPSIPSQQGEVPGTYIARLVNGHPAFELMMPPRGTLDLTNLPPCNAVIIDGDHSLETVRHDTNLATNAVCEGGVIIWHDYAFWDGCGVPEVLESMPHRDIKNVINTNLAVEFR